MNNPELIPAFSAALLLGGIAFWILPRDNPFKLENAAIQIEKFRLYLRYFIRAVFFRCQFAIGSIPLNIEYAFLQLLRCKFWLVHGYDVMDVRLTDEGERGTVNAGAAAAPKPKVNSTAQGHPLDRAG